MNGKKIGQQPWGIQQFNAISAIPIDWGSNSDAVKLISQSNYDVRASFYSTPDEAKINLQAHPEIRALFQERMGQWRNEIGSIEDNLNALYKDPSVQNSIDYMILNLISWSNSNDLKSFSIPRRHETKLAKT